MRSASARAPRLTRLGALVVLSVVLLASGDALAIARREFSGAQLKAMTTDWPRMERDAFFKKYKLHPVIFTRLRREHEGAFPEKKRGIQPAEVDKLKTDYLLVVAGLRSELEVLKANGVTYAVTDTLRTKPEHAPDFPNTKMRERIAPPKLAKNVIDDWTKVRRGELSPATFRQRYPKVRAAQLAALQDAARARIQVASGTRGRVAAEVMALSADDVALARALTKQELEIPEAKLARLRKAWVRVERREISQNALADELGIPRHYLVRYKQLHPGELLVPEPGLDAGEVKRLDKRWTEVTRGTLSAEELLAEEGISKNRLARHRTDNPGAFPLPIRSKFARAAALGEVAYSPKQLATAKRLYAQFHRAELTQAELHEALGEEGMGSTQAMEYLRTLDADAYSSREEFLDRNFDQIVDDLVRVAQEHRYVIKRWQDFAEITDKDAGLLAKWGPLRISTRGLVVQRDRRGDRKLLDALAEIGLAVGRAARSGQGREDAEDEPPPATKAPATKAARGTKAAPSAGRSDHDLAQAFADALAGAEPDPETLRRTIARVLPDRTPEAGYEKWLHLRNHFNGVIPALRPWKMAAAHQRYSLKYVARWSESMREAGPSASYDDVLRIFKQSKEYEEDGRAPAPNESDHRAEWLAEEYPELVSTRGPRARFQKERRLIELLRTAKAGASLYLLRPQLAEIGYPHVGGVYATLTRLDKAQASRLGADWNVVSVLKRKRAGLGQAVDPAFDPNAEMPELDAKLARDILETPHGPPLLEMALKRLASRKAGPQPFVSHNVMFINHRYSDLVPFAETMIQAGMAPSNAVFVSTPYPFSSSVDYQLRKLGIETYVPEQSMASMAEQVERGIRKMLEVHANQEKRKNGSGRPILILDDGGMAAKIIAAKFQEHFTKFRIVEITAAGERIAQDLVKTHGRLPFVYYSIAYSELKKRVTSEFFATRVVDKTLKLVPQTNLALRNKKAAVRGAGPMGLFAAKRLRDAYKLDVTIIEPDEDKAAAARAAGFTVLPAEKALPGRALVLGMSGYQMDPAHLRYLDDDTFVVQGSSKRQEFPMEEVERASTSKQALPRTDGLPQKSFTYLLQGYGKAKRLHFLGDGWTINHDGSLHGTPIEDIQLELAMVFESAIEAVDTSRTDTGKFRVVGKGIQDLYVDAWKELKK